MIVINYVCVLPGPLILHAERSPYKLLSMFLKTFLHALFLCQKFWNVWRRVKNVQNDFKQTDWGSCFMRFLNKFLLKSIEYSILWENMSTDFIFHLYWKLDFQNWYFSRFGTLQKTRYATVILVVLYVACLICFLKFKQFDGHNFIYRKSRAEIEKSTLKSDFTPNFQQFCYSLRRGQITRS